MFLSNGYNIGLVDLVKKNIRLLIKFEYCMGCVYIKKLLFI